MGPGNRHLDRNQTSFLGTLFCRTGLLSFAPFSLCLISVSVGLTLSFASYCFSGACNFTSFYIMIILQAMVFGDYFSMKMTLIALSVKIKNILKYKFKIVSVFIGRSSSRIG